MKEDKNQLIELSFLVDLCGKLNNLNLELQGKDKKVIDMLSSIKVFELIQFY